jgi:hypothetical protein
MSRRKDVSIFNLVFFGTAAGLAGARAMTQFTKMWNGLSLWRSYANSSPLPPVPYSDQEWDSTSRIAEAIGSAAFGRRLSAEEKKTGAAVVHYAIGGAAGVVYAILVQHRSIFTNHSGTFFGLGLWLIADELLMPCLRLSRKLGSYPFRAQANSLGEHLVYAVTTDFVYRCSSAQ